MQKEFGTHKLNILNLSTSPQGGAGAISLYFNDLFNNNGYNSWLFVKQTGLVKNHVIGVRKTSSNIFKKLIIRFKDRLNYIKRVQLFENKYFFFKTNESKEYVTAKEIISKLTFRPDVINVFWVSNFVNVKTIQELANATNAKIIWFMTDNAPLTGGCHYPWDCLGFQTDCLNCPAILKVSRKDISKNNLAFKKEFIPFNSEVIAGSEFDYLRAKQSSLFKNKKIHKVLAPVDENRYLPIDKSIPKLFFGIEPKIKIIFYAAAQLNNIRKGASYFLEAMSTLQETLLNEGKSPDDWLIVIAGMDVKEFNANIGIPIKGLGYLNEDNLIKAYQAADVFVSTSIEDSGPWMINQSIMCGTPVVSFAMGVSLDLVITGETGYRAKLKDSADLANGINYLMKLNKVDYNKMRQNCRNIGLKFLKPQVQIAKLNSIFQNSIDTYH